ncbi:hypothetical protein [Streptomyces celluloflavus]
MQETGTPALRDPYGIPECLAQPSGEIPQLPGIGTRVAEQLPCVPE